MVGATGRRRPRRCTSTTAPAGSPNVWLFVGVNGVGKTTTIGKVAHQQIAAGRSVVMAAGDTFRAAAAEQLGTWAERSGAELVRGAEGGDPQLGDLRRRRARPRRATIDLVLADTAGRLHTKTNLMEELRKVRRVAEKGAGPGHRGAARDRRHHRARTAWPRPASSGEAIERHRRRAHQARRLGQGRHRVRHRDRARHPDQARRPRRDDRRPGRRSTPTSSSTPCSTAASPPTDFAK